VSAAIPHEQASAVGPTRSWAGPGQSLARYVCLRRIARGGMAELFLARREGPAGFRKLVALKRLLPHLADDPTFARMFIAEARLAAGLSHPHIAQVLDVGELEGRSFLAMEYVHGQDLRAVLQQAGRTLAERRIALRAAVAIVEAVADALHHAHEQRGPGQRLLELVHRDVSPSNVLLGYDGSVKLADFGIAKANAETQATATHSLKGKIAYMSPEQARGEPVDRRSDVFSLGIVLFEVTTGYRLFSGASEFAILNQVARGEVAAPCDVMPEYPADLQAIVMRALAPVVDDRYPTAQALAQDLRAFAAAHGGRADRDELSSLMHALFEATPYPDPDALEPDAEQTRDLGPATRSRYDTLDVATTHAREAPRRRVPAWGWAVLTLAAGVGLGVGLAGSAEDEPSATPVEAAALPQAPTEAALAPEATPVEAIVAGSSGADVVVELEPEAEAPTPTPTSPPEGSRRGRTRRTKPKRAESTTAPATLDRWKPPSQQ
jgi:serine/threonine protein kinase